MTGDEHYHAAEAWLQDAKLDGLTDEAASVQAQIAQTHAILAAVAALTSQPQRAERGA